MAPFQAGTDPRERFLLQAEAGLDNLTPAGLTATPERVVHVVRAFGANPPPCASLRLKEMNYAPHGDAIEAVIVAIPGIKIGVQDFAGIMVAMNGDTIIEEHPLPYLASSSTEASVQIDFCPDDDLNAQTQHSSPLGGPFESRPLPWPGAGDACVADTANCSSTAIGDPNYTGNKCVAPCLPRATHCAFTQKRRPHVQRCRESCRCPREGRTVVHPHGIHVNDGTPPPHRFVYCDVYIKMESTCEFEFSDDIVKLGLSGEGSAVVQGEQEPPPLAGVGERTSDDRLSAPWCQALRWHCRAWSQPRVVL